EGRVAHLPARAEGVGDVELGPLGAELLEGDRGRDEVRWADLEEVREDPATLVRVAKVKAALAEFLREIVIDVDRRPTTPLAAKLIRDGVAAGAEPLAGVTDAVDRRVVGRQDTAE